MPGTRVKPAFSLKNHGLPRRDAVAESLDEDGILTVNAYTLAGNALTCTTRRYGPFPVPHSQFPTYETTVRDASYGTIPLLWRRQMKWWALALLGS